MMPKDPAPPRQRPVSCRFCRTRRLRCSREAPCSNCASRSLRCELEPPVAGDSSIRRSAPAEEILERLQRLEHLLVTEKGRQEEHANSSPASHVPQSPSPAFSPLEIQGLAHDVAELEGIYTGQGVAPGTIPSRKMVFRICPIHQITEAPSYISSPDFPSTTSGEPFRCVWLPQPAEAHILLEKYLRHVNHVHHVTHVPSLPRLFDDIYTAVLSHGQVKPGHVILLLSICASATHSWVRADVERRLFSTAAEANDQASWWVTATQDVLDIAHRSVSVSIEGIQGIIIVSFVLGNLEGFSRRCRSLLSTALFLARDLGLHRIDHPSHADKANTAQAEIGRRVWWYLCASDWLLAAGLVGPSEGVYACHLRQMITKKPLNINDEDVFDGMSCVERPLSQPTVMSYSLQRIRLAEISRNIVDRTPLITAPLGDPIRDHLMEIDTELQMLANDIPPFFSMSRTKLMETWELSQEQAADICLQRYMVYFLLYAQRCKLHLPYFTRGFTNPVYASSRDLCVRIARLMIQAETDLDKSRLGTATRFKFTGLLLGVFMASVVLLMDLCMNKSSPHHEQQRGEVAEAFRILDQAKDESDTAAVFVGSLMLILRKHQVSPPVPPPRQASSQQRPPGSGSEEQQKSFGGEATDGTRAPSLGVLPVTDNSGIGMADDEGMSYFNELSQSFEQGLDVGDFNWDDIFSSLDSSFV